jgi:hypothetical protein
LANLVSTKLVIFPKIMSTSLINPTRLEFKLFLIKKSYKSAVVKPIPSASLIAVICIALVLMVAANSVSL